MQLWNEVLFHGVLCYLIMCKAIHVKKLLFCAGVGLKELGRQLHSNLIKMDIGSNSFLGVGLIGIRSAT